MEVRNGARVVLLRTGLFSGRCLSLANPVTEVVRDVRFST